MGTLDRWTDNQVAFIIGHEMAHHALDHHVEGLSFFCLETVLGVMVIFYAIIRRMLMLALLWILLRPFKFLVTYPVRCKREVDADVLGLEMAARACFDVREVIHLWEDVESLETTSNRRRVAMLSDHPSDKERKDRLVDRMDKMLAVMEEAGCAERKEWVRKVCSCPNCRPFI